MIKITKEESERLVLSVLTELSKTQDTCFAEQSLKLMENSYDSMLLTGVLLTKGTPSVLTKEENILKDSLITIIGSFFYSVKDDGIDIKNDFSKKLIDFMSKEDLSIKGYKESTRMKFAISSFASAFFEFERLEKKYPDIMVFM
jgi:hypothetical protein